MSCICTAALPTDALLVKPSSPQRHHARGGCTRRHRGSIDQSCDLLQLAELSARFWTEWPWAVKTWSELCLLAEAHSALAIGASVPAMASVSLARVQLDFLGLHQSLSTSGACRASVVSDHLSVPSNVSPSFFVDGRSNRKTIFAPTSHRRQTAYRDITYRRQVHHSPASLGSVPASDCA